MYNCGIHFYFIGCADEFAKTVKSAPPLDKSFSHEFSESGALEKELISAADVIFMDMSRPETAEKTRGGLKAAASAKKSSAAIILLADKKTMPSEEEMSVISDIWITPLSEGELRFRLGKLLKRCKTEMDLWQTGQFLEAAINSTPNLVWYKDKNGIHEKVNDSFCKTVNKPKELVEGRGHAFIWDVECDDPACIKSETEVMTRRETIISDEVIQTGDGKRLLTTYKSPLYNYDGSVMGTVGVAIDVTKERAFEEELTNRNHSLEKIFTSIDCGVLCHSLDGKRVLSVNRAALKILGYETREEMLEKGFDMVADSVFDEDKALLREKMKTLKNEDDNVSIEYRVRHGDGSVLHVVGNVKMLRANGELYYQRFLLDVTAQRRQERENERRQTELIQALGIDYNLICFFDLNSGKGSTLRINNCEKLVLKETFSGDMNIENWLDRYIEKCVYAEDRSALSAACSREGLLAELSEKNTYYINYRTVCGGEIKYFQMKAVRTGEWGGSRCVVVGFRSVDDEMRSEMEKKDLLENALMQANRANKAKSTFLSNMSHDIRTPMNAIVGFTSLAINHIDNKEQVEEYLKKIMMSGDHLLSLINDVLDMSRIESGKMRLEEKPCSLPEILHGLRSILQADIHAKQLEFCIDTVDVFDEDVICDKLRLNQVLLNLLSNAVKYTGAGGAITFRITERRGAPKGCACYEFLIKDTGIGMSEEFVSHIFEPFERERNTTISGIQGTGLGMAITKNIVDMMGGTIEVKSKQGVGTECKVSFTFRLNAEAKEPQELPDFKDCRALVVDDDFNTCDSVSYMLQQLGMRAEWTLSGKEAILRVRQAHTRGDDYRAYIVDCFLPDMNGIEVVRRIRRETGGNVPVIVITAYDWTDIEEEAREAGVSAFCSKPLFLSELRRCLSSISAPQSSEKSSSDRRAAKRHSGRILLTEDNELNQEIAAELLSEVGFTVEIAGNGQIAVDMIKGSNPGYYQLVLMDVQMPVMNGYEATKAIRGLENKALASIPIIAMTANAFEEDKQDALDSGMNGHIAKPINADILFKTLDKILS